MASGDETRWDDRSSFFGDDAVEEPTQVVQNPYPNGQPPRRQGVHPNPPLGHQPQTPGRPARPAPTLPPARYGAQQANPPGFGDGFGDGFGGAGGLGSGQAEADFFGSGAGAEPGRGPTILANQASDWDGNFQDASVSRGARGGMIGLFILGLVAVVVVALGLAAWSVLRGGDGDGGTATTDTIGTETSVPTSDTSTPTSTPVETAPPPDPNALQHILTEDPFVCDGGTREFALISGADPNEAVSFTSPQADGLRSGQADANGELPIRWQCDPEQAGTTWELTATGDVSGRSATFLFAGVIAPGTSTPPPTPTEMTVQVIEDPFVCDGAVRVFAGLAGADPNETINFTSPQSPGLRAGQADANGETPIRWQCDPDQTGMVWELTATGETSGRSVTFSFTGG